MGGECPELITSNDFPRFHTHVLCARVPRVVECRFCWLILFRDVGEGMPSSCICCGSNPFSQMASASPDPKPLLEAGLCDVAVPCRHAIVSRRVRIASAALRPILQT